MVTSTSAPARIHTARYRVAASDSVRTLAHRGREFLRKPPVMASAKLLELGEGICMEALRESLRPDECSLGTRQLAAHRGAIRIGATLAIAARRVGGDGSRSDWYVAVREEPGGGEAGSKRLVWEAMLSFAVVDGPRFEAEMAKPGQLAAAPTSRPSLAGRR